MTKKSFIAACVQINSSNDLAKNITHATELIREAAKKGAEFITLPESAFFMGASREDTLNHASKMDEHTVIVAMSSLAAELKTWLLFGLAVHSDVNDKLANRLVLIDSNGKVAAHYDKIHLYDASIKGGESHCESNTFTYGDKAVLANLPWAKLGMTICYDLRFPHLFRKLAQENAALITVPAAFTYKTGEAHWHTLLRARAIENTCYIIAPAQCGHHPRGRRTYGHSLIIDPWGKIIAEASEENEEVIVAEIDLNKVAEVREQLPSLMHDKPF